MSRKKGKRPVAECQHTWEPFSAKQVGSVNAFIDMARTVVLLRCGICGDLNHRIVPGHWTLNEVKRR